MKHDYSLVFETDNEYWNRVLEIFAKNEKYPKKRVSNRNLHHKFPRSFSKMLGEPVDNDSDNLISLSLADHFLVHYYYYLLAKKGFRQRMATAFTFMAKKGLKYMTPETAEQMAKDYEEAEVISNKFNSEMMKGREVSKETRKKLSEMKKGKKLKPLTDEHKRKISEGNKGKHCGPTGKPAWNKGISPSEETRRKISENSGHECPWKGQQLSEETKQKMKEHSQKGRHWKLVDGKRVWYD